MPTTATAEVALPGVSAGQHVWVDGTPQRASARPAGAAQPGAAAAGLAVVAVGSGWHQVATTP